MLARQHMAFGIELAAAHHELVNVYGIPEEAISYAFADMCRSRSEGKSKLTRRVHEEVFTRANRRTEAREAAQ
jgi:hypothetical protein